MNFVKIHYHWPGNHFSLSRWVNRWRKHEKEWLISYTAQEINRIWELKNMEVQYIMVIRGHIILSNFNQPLTYINRDLTSWLISSFSVCVFSSDLWSFFKKKCLSLFLLRISGKLTYIWWTYGLPLIDLIQRGPRGKLWALSVWELWGVLISEWRVKVWCHHSGATGTDPALPTHGREQQGYKSLGQVWSSSLNWHRRLKKKKKGDAYFKKKVHILLTLNFPGESTLPN